MFLLRVGLLTLIKIASLINLVRSSKRIPTWKEGLYTTMYPTGCMAPTFYGLPNIHKMGTSLRPIVSIRGSVT